MNTNQDKRITLKENTNPDSPDRLCIEKDWKGLFPEDIVSCAEKSSTLDKLEHVSSWNGLSAYYYPDADELKKDGIKARKTRSYSWGADSNGLYYDDNNRPYYRVDIYRRPVDLDDDWDPSMFKCSCRKAQNGQRCIHEAALLAWITRQYGGKYMVEERDFDYEERKCAIQCRKNREQEEKLAEELGTDPVPALGFFRGRKETGGIHLYDMKAALAHMTTNAYSMKRAEELLKENNFKTAFQEDIDRYGNHRANGSLVMEDIVYHFSFTAGRASIAGSELTVESEKGFRDGHMKRNGYVYEKDAKESTADHAGGSGFLNANGLVLCTALWNYCDKLAEKVEDLTDEKAKLFFTSLAMADEQEIEKADEPEIVRSKTISLHPRIIMEDGDARLSFKIEQEGARPMVVKNMRELTAAYEERKTLALSKKESVSFALNDFTDDSLPLFHFIERRIDEIYSANARFEDKNSRYSVNTLNVTSSLELNGALLDGFYDTWSGHSAEYTDKSNSIKAVDIPVGHRPLKFALAAKKLTDARGTFAGVAVEGLLPVLLEGSGSTRYTLNARGLSRITPEEQREIRPFDAISDSSGYFRFQVGTDHLQEFYYRVVPSFLDNKVIQFKDECEEEAEQYLPPEPRFDFWLDCENTKDVLDGKGSLARHASFHQAELHDKEYMLVLKADVSYEDKDEAVRKYPVLSKSDDSAYRDDQQEQRVDRVIRRFLPQKTADCYLGLYDDDSLFDFLRSSLPVLERYGTVHGTDAFRIHKVKKVPSIKLGVSVDSGLMDLSLTSQDLAPDELLAVFNSYHQKKRFHKLSSGDYIDLSQSDELADIGDLLAGLDLSEEEVIHKSASLPLFRALYLEKLLESHESIVSSRDRVYRALLRNFHTVRDSEAEPPASLENVLRPYQTYGFKWIKTLESAGFGGILADEMGLGKTLQMIAVLLSDYSEKHAPSLVVCPASLVYNWQEEFSKFAPGMKVVPVSGGAVQRRKAWEKWNDAQVYIMSYDLLKRNIAEISGKSFFYIILDEAQYIKNAGTSAAKSVKALKAEHRFALTGTPIENRLNELWSIFDFLMPGFLYDRKEFEERLEIPITKMKDEEATQKLKNMTSPFILRRRKEEVLKDLPEKLEEVRYVPISGKQQELYDAQVVRTRNAIEKSSTPGSSKIQVFAELTRIREICCDPSLVFNDYQDVSAKREACMGLIHQAIDGGHRMLVFSQFVSMLALLQKDLQKENIPYFLLTGDTPKEKRIQLVHEFNEGDTPVFLISLKAGGTGLNLTGADVVIHYDPWWNLAAQNQATDRAHRIGQTKQVTVYKLIMKDTIEEKILDLQNAKKDLADSILEGDSRALSSLSREELLELLD